MQAPGKTIRAASRAADGLRPSGAKAAPGGSSRPRAEGSAPSQPGANASAQDRGPGAATTHGPSFLGAIEIVIPGEVLLLHECGQEDGGPGPLPPPRRLEAQAMRWAYVLRSRERWLGKIGASQEHEDDAVRTMRDFGIDDAALQLIAGASRVVVRMPYRAEGVGWAGRVFPWEYVIAAATRRHRRAQGHHLTVMRELRPAQTDHPIWQPSGGERTLLFVQSAPGGLRQQWDFSGELVRLQRALAGIRVEVLTDPTWEQLHDRVRDLRPDLVHLSGFDNLQGLKALRELVPDRDPVESENGPFALGDLLADERKVQDGMLLAGSETGVAEALNASGKHCAYFVGVSMENSAARTAALIVGECAALAAVGFQDAIENALVDYFFELFYTQLSALAAHAPLPAWDAPLAFEQAWLSARVEPNATRATGIALWAGAPLMPERARAAIAAEVRCADTPPRVMCQPESELNYAVLHNSGVLFRQFVVERGNACETDWIDVDVELHLGAEPARFSRRFRADRSRFDLTSEVHLPLTASLMRSLQEAINSTLVIQLAHNGGPLERESHRLRLLPVDQWRDNDRDGQWLPSFVLPRDPAVGRAVEQAQRYVRVLRDDPAAGFEGYQAAPTTEEEQLREVDLQVQAIWATLVHEWQLGYINPPPSYSGNLDSQRLRTPSTVLGGRSGTCIDLALLFAACLELVDIYPVIFLLQGHALPGYWRHCDFRDDYRALRAGTGWATAHGVDTDPNSSGTRQVHSWQALGRAAFREVRQLIRARQLVPIETVRLTEYCGFVDAIESGVAALSEPGDFHSMLDVVTARQDGITPLPIVGGQS
jgi:hypothetical protein